MFDIKIGVQKMKEASSAVLDTAISIITKRVSKGDVRILSKDEKTLLRAMGEMDVRPRSK